jgi:hypothetical protein
MVLEYVADGESIVIADRIKDIRASEGRFRMAFNSRPPGTSSRLVCAYGQFKYELRPKGHDRNEAKIGAAPYVLDVEEAGLGGSLKPGRRVVFEDARENGTVVGHEAIVISMSGNKIGAISPPIVEGEGFRVGSTVIRGNAVRAGHGEARPQRVLGSGNAAMSSQGFVLAVAGVAFVPDSTMPSGVSADIDVSVDGRAWKQVASLRGSESADPHYEVRMTEEGFVRVVFGDGARGRRLPTGSNNVRVRYRVGNGDSGNLPARSLSAIVKPHAAVAAVLQDLPASGGGDLEGVASLRERAPASLLALERAVSIGDYACLAARSGIWQARAHSRVAGVGRQERVEVIVVPAGGIALDRETMLPIAGESARQAAKALLDKRRDALKLMSPPGVDVSVTLFEPVLVGFKVVAYVKSSEYEPDAVVKRVELALADAFSLRARKLGEPLRRSEVYRVVEGVEGVEYSDCAISEFDEALVSRVVARDDASGSAVQSLVPFDRQVVYFDAQGKYRAAVTAEEYVL